MQSQDNTPDQDKETAETLAKDFIDSVGKDESVPSVFPLSTEATVDLSTDPDLAVEAVCEAQAARAREEAACTEDDPRRVVDEHIADLEALEAGNAVEVDEGLMREIIIPRKCSSPIEHISIEIKVPKMNEAFEDLDDGLPPPETSDGKALTDDEAINRMSGGGVKAKLDETHEFLENAEEFRETAGEDPSEAYLLAYPGVGPALATLMLVKEVKKVAESLAGLAQAVAGINQSVTELKEILTRPDHD